MTEPDQKQRGSDQRPSEPPVGRSGSVPDPYVVGVDVLLEFWEGEAVPHEIVAWIFTALDEAGDTTIPRDSEARERAEAMVGQVFADLAFDPGGVDRGPVVSNALRAAKAVTHA